MRTRLNAVGLAQDLIRFPTVNPPGDERACAEHLGKILEPSGFSVSFHEFAPGRTSLLARLDGAASRAPLCLAGHIDTVPLGAAPWKVDPFGGVAEGGKLYGRGASDMKSGVAALVTAAVELATLQGAAGLVLAIVAGEETGCEGSYHMAGLPDALGTAEALVVAEPTANYPLVGHKGALWLLGRTRGVTAHGSMPEKGVNAVYKAARAVTRLEHFRFGIPPHLHLGSPTLNVGTVSGGLNINSVPDEATIGIDIRTVPGQDHDRVQEELREVLGDEVEVSRLLSVQSLWTDPDDPWVQEVFATMTAILGFRPEVRTVAYFTDAAALTPAFGNAPTVILGPGEPGMAHQTDEYCYVDRIHQAVDAYVNIGRKWYGT